MAELVSVPLISKNGIRGKVVTASRLLDDSPEKSVTFENGRTVSIPSKLLHLRPDGSYYLDLTVNNDSPASVASPVQVPTNDLVMPVIQEVAQLTKNIVETGRVRVRKTVTEEVVTVDEALLHEEYEVRHVPINRVVESMSPTRLEGDTTIISVYHEETVTVTRLVLREELHLVKKQRVEHRPRTITLRKENVTVERTQSQSSSK